MASQWSYWINEPVFLDKGVSNIVKRKQAIYLFCCEGLIPFVEKHGFKLRYKTTQLTRIVLRLLFQMERGKKVKPLAYEDNLPMEMYQLYSDIFDFERWESFWSRWADYQDFEEGKPGFPLRSSLSEFVWSWVDFDFSPAIERLLQDLEDADSSDELSKGKEDPYLQDTSKRDYQDRHW